MAFFVSELIGKTFGAVGTLGKNAYRGARGTTEHVDPVTGQRYLQNSFQKFGADLSQRYKSIKTGYKYDAEGNVIGDVNRAGQIIGMVSDITLGTAGQALGWTTRGLGLGVAGVAGVAAKPLAKGAQHLASGALDVVGDTAINAVGFAADLSKTRIGSGVLFTAPLAGSAFLGATNENIGGHLKDQLVAQVGAGLKDIEALPGQVTPSQKKVYNSQQFDNFGADGDLVFAMHNQR